MKLRTIWIAILVYGWINWGFIASSKADSESIDKNPTTQVAEILTKPDNQSQSQNPLPSVPLRVLLYWLFVAEEQQSVTASQTLSEAMARIPSVAGPSVSGQVQILKNYDRARHFGLFTPEGLKSLLSDSPLVALRGRSKGQTLAVILWSGHSGRKRMTVPDFWADMELVPARYINQPQRFEPDEKLYISSQAIHAQIVTPAQLTSYVPLTRPAPLNAPPAPGVRLSTRLREHISLAQWGIRDWDLEVTGRDTLEIRAALVSRTKKIHKVYLATPGRSSGSFGTANYSYQPGTPGGVRDYYERIPFTVSLTTGFYLPGVPEKAFPLHESLEVKVYVLEQPLSVGADSVCLLFVPIVQASKQPNTPRP